MNTPKLFLTDYASYNEGKQFEFGHWVDLTDFDDAEEFMEYVTEHLEEISESRGELYEEPMFTDYENLPESLYAESLSLEDLEKIYGLIQWLKDNGLESFENEGENLLSAWNEYCSENNPDDEIFHFDDETIQMLCGDDPMKCFMAGVNASINWSDNYLYLDGYANINSTNDPSNRIDEALLFEWIIDNL